MAYTIAVSGKGGTGKTTIATLIIDILARSESRSILAVDADPATNLHLALGLPLGQTVGQVREEALAMARAGAFPQGLSKQDFFEYQIQDLLVEGNDVDLLAMGRPEGPGCYCSANNMLRAILDRIARSYDWVVIDTEAGMEHLSRHTTRDVDYLLLISDPTVRGVRAAAIMARMVPELKINVGRIGFALNRLPAGDWQALYPYVLQTIEEEGLRLVAALPEDPIVAEFDATGKPMRLLPPESPLRLAVADLVRRELLSSAPSH